MRDTLDNGVFFVLEFQVRRFPRVWKHVGSLPLHQVGKGGSLTLGF